MVKYLNLFLKLPLLTQISLIFLALALIGLFAFFPSAAMSLTGIIYFVLGKKTKED